MSLYICSTALLPAVLLWLVNFTVNAAEYSATCHTHIFSVRLATCVCVCGGVSQVEQTKV